MSNSKSTTRRILDAARTLLEAGHADVSMGAIASAAGVTRQLLYHHFDGRAHLLLELSRLIDAEVRTAALQAEVDEAPTGIEALRATVAVQGRIKPQIDGITAAMDRLRPDDLDVATAWDEREAARLRRCRFVVVRLRDEGNLTDDWSVRDASRLLWSLTSQRAWRDLTNAGWSTSAWVRHTTTLAERALTT